MNQQYKYIAAYTLLMITLITLPGCSVEQPTKNHSKHMTTNLHKKNSTKEKSHHSNKKNKVHIEEKETLNIK